MSKEAIVVGIPPAATSLSSQSTDEDVLKEYQWPPKEQSQSRANSQAPIPSDELETVLDEEENELTNTHITTLLGGLFQLRARDDDDPIDWWFASTAIPLLSATFAPLANVLSIAALVVSWRNTVTDNTNPALKYSTSVGYPDPRWCLDLNGASLACGFVGNIFLLCNFTRKIRYIIALPVTILLFYLAAGILIGITVGMDKYDPPKAEDVYSQGYWYAVIAACVYMLNAMLLMVNMLGYFLGHYPQHFDLNDEQRNLILQTMIFFVWLAGGAGIFARIEGLAYTDALYFCDVTLLTIGFGDFVATTDTGRGLVLPYTIGGIIILGLMVSSIHKFAQELSKEKVVKKHVESRRVNTLSRAVTLQDQMPAHLRTSPGTLGTRISRPLEAAQIQHDLDEKAKLDKVMKRTIDFQAPARQDLVQPSEAEPAPHQFRFQPDNNSKFSFRTLTLDGVTSLRHRFPVLLPTKSQKAILMKSEKDRFDKMRDIQNAAKQFKKWYGLFMAVISFGTLWCVGAIVFWRIEADTQSLSYFQALYFCYVSLLTVGYGDLSPKSNAGKPFFVLWSLIAVPTMTILISDLGDTAIGGFKRKVLQYGGLAFLGKGRGWGLDWFTKRKAQFQRRLSAVGVASEKASRLEEGAVPDRALSRAGQTDDVEGYQLKTIEELAEEQLSEPEVVRQLAYTLRTVADDMKHRPDKRYSYEEWVEFTRLIRFTKLDRRLKDTAEASEQLEYDEALDGLIEWDWLDENSPMTSEQSEAEWVMDRLLESLIRIFRKQEILQELEKSAKSASASSRASRRYEPMSIEFARRASMAFGKTRQDSSASDQSGRADGQEEGTEVQDQPQWSKRGKARLHQKHLKHRVRPVGNTHGHVHAVVPKHSVHNNKMQKSKHAVSSVSTTAGPSNAGNGG